ncbi:Kelch repeat-containing protein [Burkholderia ambifaria]|uniref:Kelch repeat-containing protein n=1 Tax=Burkholderia ambifaria TaxID=152480 RepID=UPI0015906660|nr:kelch-like protein [Burkholderia ambifaria]
MQVKVSDPDNYPRVRAAAALIAGIIGLCVASSARPDGGCDYGGANLFYVGGKNASGQCVNTVRVLTPGATGWQLRAKMPTARSGLAFVRGGKQGLLYAIGGENCAGKALNTVEAYNEDTDTWRTVATLPVPLTGSAAAAVDGLIYVFGGTTMPDNSAAASSRIYVYDPQKDTWRTSSATMNPARLMGRAVVTHDDTVLLACGTGPDGEALGLVQRFDPVHETLSTLSQGLSTARSACGMAADGNGTVFVMGGQSGSAILDTVETLDPSSGGTWQTSSTRLMRPTTRLSATVDQLGNLVLPSGVHPGQSGDASDVEEIDPVAPAGAHTVTLYLHGQESSPDYGGLIMDQTVPHTASAPVTIGLLGKQSWASFPAFTGTLARDAKLTLTLPCTAGLGVLSGIQVESFKAADRSGSQVIASKALPLALCVGVPSVDVDIPLMAEEPVSLDAAEISLTLYSLIGGVVNLTPDTPMKLAISGFTGLPGHSTAFNIKSDPPLP